MRGKVFLLGSGCLSGALLTGFLLGRSVAPTGKGASSASAHSGRPPSEKVSDNPQHAASANSDEVPRTPASVEFDAKASPENSTPLGNPNASPSIEAALGIPLAEVLSAAHTSFQALGGNEALDTVDETEAPQPSPSLDAQHPQSLAPESLAPETLATLAIAEESEPLLRDPATRPVSSERATGDDPPSGVFTHPLPQDGPPLTYTPSASAQRRGASALVGQNAPEVDPAAWTPGDRPPFSLRNSRGKVVVVYAFQSWCPGCQRRGFPVTRALERHFSNRVDVEFLYIQTPFEGHSVNTYQRLVIEKLQWRIERPLAQDRLDRGGTPRLMRDYRTAGTPWHIVIDKQGTIRFNDFTRDAPFFEEMIRSLL